MGFFSEILGTVVKVALTPVAVIKDVVNVATGEPVESTISLLQDAKDGASQAMDDLCDGEL